MMTPLLQTKLHIPRLRPELVRLLNAGLHRDAPLQVAWLSLNEGGKPPKHCDGVSSWLDGDGLGD